jgi:hypothetical protein
LSHASHSGAFSGRSRVAVSAWGAFPKRSICWIRGYWSGCLEIWWSK